MTGARVAAIAWSGLLALAVAMGIGRFAFTPILPMMEADAGLTLAAAGWLAAANYLGYLLGALSAARLSLPHAVRGGLLLIAVVTFAMGITHVFVVQLALRLLAGIASAWVLIHVSAWALGQLARRGHTRTNGIVFAGVGVGIAAAGLVCMATMHVRWGADHTWQLFGVLSLVSALALWPTFGGADATPTEKVHAPPAPLRWNADKWRLMACYGAFGFGYIIPATFLPAMAHHYISNPLVFGLAWPVFGTASALSTWLVARWFEGVDNRRLWAGSYVLMAIGVALPVLWPGLAAILVAALLVGGTFMLDTMAGLREARAVAPASATSFIAAMTAAFALMQMLGPVVVSLVARLRFGFAAALLAAALVLLLAAVTLWRSASTVRPRAGDVLPPSGRGG